MPDNWSPQQGDAILTSRTSPPNSWKVRYSITFSLRDGVADVVHNIEITEQGSDIPSGLYDLIRTVGGAENRTGVKKTPVGWATLPA